MGAFTKVEKEYIFRLKIPIMERDRKNLENSELVKIGYQCSEEGCNWKMVAKNNKKLPEYYEALREFGPHNIKEHGGSIGVHLIPVTKIINRKTSN